MSFDFSRIDFTPIVQWYIAEGHRRAGQAVRAATPPPSRLAPDWCRTFHGVDCGRCA